MSVLVLASQSPRRLELLREAGFSPIVRPSNVSESPIPGETPEDYVRRLAREKASTVACADNEVVLGADTIVLLDGEILEKPLDSADAARMLRLLSGRDHEVLTSVCLLAPHRGTVDVSRTRVWFHPISEADIQEYVATGEPMDKAGAYGIQGKASRFVDRIEGCYFNVVGLPVSLVYRRLREME